MHKKHDKRKILFPELRKRVQKAGHPPGTAIYTGEKTDTIAKVTLIHYTAELFSEKTGHTLAECLPEIKEEGVTWVHVDGLSNTTLIKEIATHFNLHLLTVEDILNIEQRPKIEE